MMTKPCMSIEDHKMASELIQAVFWVQSAFIELCNGKVSKPLHAKVCTMDKTVVDLRNRLENELHERYGPLQESIYYPPFSNKVFR